MPGRAAAERSERHRVDPLLLAVVAAFAAAPYWQFLHTNRLEILDVGRVLELALGTVLVAVGGAAALQRRVGPVVATVWVVVAVFLFFNFGPIDDAIGGWMAVLAWLLVVVGGAVLAGDRAARSAGGRTFLLLLGAAMAVTSAAPLLVWELGAARAAPQATPSDRRAFIDAVVGDRPDVYLFILDAYAREDQLEQHLGFDNQPTIAALEELGFTVAEDSRAAYPITPLSVSSMFEAAYPVTAVEQLARGLDAFGPVLTGDNRTVRTFESLGYEYWYANPGRFDAMRCQPRVGVRCLPVNVDQPLGSEVGLLLGQLTPLGLLPAFDPPVELPDPLDIVELTAGAGNRDTPRFVHAHIMSPHEPFRLLADCSRREPPIDRLGPRTGVLGDAYAAQLSCLNSTLLEAMTQLVAADPSAVIAVVSDHGDWFTTEFPGPDAGAAGLEQRFANLSALRLPQCPERTAVRELPALFPTIFSCLGGVELEVPPPRRFYVDYDGRFGELDDDLEPTG